MEKIKCPLVNREIDDGICFDISMVAEGVAPERTISKEIRENPDLREICLKCEYHKD